MATQTAASGSRKRGHEGLPLGWRTGWSKRRQRPYYYDQAAPSKSYWSLDHVGRQCESEEEEEEEEEEEGEKDEVTEAVVGETRPVVATALTALTPTAPPAHLRTRGPASDCELIRHHPMDSYSSMWHLGKDEVNREALATQGDIAQYGRRIRCTVVAAWPDLPPVLSAIVGDYLYQSTALLYRPPIPARLEPVGNDANRQRLWRAYPRIRDFKDYYAQPQEAERLFKLEYGAAMLWISPAVCAGGRAASGHLALHQAVVDLIGCQCETQVRSIVQRILDVVEWKGEAPAPPSSPSSSSSSPPSSSTTAVGTSPPADAAGAASGLAPPSDMNVFGAAVAHAFVDTLRQHLSTAQLEALDQAYYTCVDATLTHLHGSRGLTRQWWSGDDDRAGGGHVGTSRAVYRTSLYGKSALVDDRKSDLERAHFEDPFQLMHPLHCLVRCAYRLGSAWKEEAVFQCVFACARTVDTTVAALSLEPAAASALDTLLRTVWLKTIAYALGNLSKHRAHRIDLSTPFGHTYIVQVLLYCFSPLFAAGGRGYFFYPHPGASDLFI